MTQNQIYKTILNTISDQVYIRDVDKNVMYMNSAAEELTGWPFSEVRFKKCYEVFGDEKRLCKRNCPVDRAIDQQEAILHHEGELKTRSGEIRKTKVSITPVADCNQTSGAVVVMRDVTELQLLEKNHEKASIELEKEVSLRKNNEQFFNAILNSIQDGISVLDTDLNIVVTNTAMHELFSHALPLEGKRCYEAYHNRSKQCSPCPVLRCYKTKKLEMNQVPLKRPGYPDGVLELYAFPMLDQQGIPKGVVEYVRDITEKKLIEKLLIIQRDLGISFGSIDDFQQALSVCVEAVFKIDEIDCAAICVVDPKDGSIRLSSYKNLPAWYVKLTTRFDREAPHTQLVMKGESIFCSFAQALSTLELSDDEKNKRKVLGMRAFGMIPIKYEQNVIAVLNVSSQHSDNFQEFTQYALDAIAVQVAETLMKIRSNDALRASQNNFKALFENLGDLLFVLDDTGQIVGFNPVVRDRLGYSDDQLLKMNLLDLLVPGHQREVEKIVRKILAGQTKCCSIPLVTKNNKQIPVETMFTAGTWDNKNAMFGISRDITQRIEAEEARELSEERLLAAIDAIDEGFAIYDTKDRLTMFNTKFREIYKESADAIVPGQCFEDILRYSVKRRQYAGTNGREDDWVAERMARHKLANSSFEQKLNDGRWIKIAERKTKDGGTVSFRVDITDIKKSEEIAQKALKEKETLLREIHHRVKNNMQVISSLLSLQANKLNDPNTIKAFEEAENRVHSMSLVHEILYQSDTITDINLQTYLEKLIQHFSNMFYQTSKIKIKITAKNIILYMEQAITCGLIVTEVVSNALKYAFPDNSSGLITIDVQQLNDNRYEMRIADNGIGFPKGFDWENSRTLGLRLIRELVLGQLEGSLNLIEDDGVCWVITWNYS